MSRRIGLSIVLPIVLLGLALPAPAAAAGPPTTVAIIVGPVGEELTPVYIGLAEAAAAAAEAHGAVVERAYSPAATPANVLAAVEGANVVVYLGHGVGTPNPYSDVPDPAATNGWGLQGPNARGDHSDSWSDGTLAYYGEAWIAAHARPAPGWVMIYSNACYAPGAGEAPFYEQATPDVAAGRVAMYSRVPLVDLGASAYFAIDFYEGAARLIATLLGRPDLPYGAVFAAEPLFDPAALAVGLHPAVAGAEVWLHRSPYFDGKVDYWYAFAGDPNASFDGSASAGGAAVDGARPASVAGVHGPAALVPVGGVVSGVASYYDHDPGWQGQPTVALPAEMGGAIPTGEPTTVVVCADRCVEMPVVDACPCYVGTADQRVANLSAAGWAAISDRPLSDGLLPVEVHLEPDAARRYFQPPGDAERDA